MKAGGADPLADFLFHVKQGHCEYFATALGVMLRTQGIATRVVNGFLPGEYNQAAGAFTVRQSDAHSWVEVYFPQTNSWVTFDPTPPAGRTPRERTGLAGA
jgi:transglutaminase-like putative cysteine protease